MKTLNIGNNETISKAQARLQDALRRREMETAIDNMFMSWYHRDNCYRILSRRGKRVACVKWYIAPWRVRVRKWARRAWDLIIYQ